MIDAESKSAAGENPAAKLTADERKLRGVHPDLVRIVLRALEHPPVPFMVFEGVRSAKRQAELYAAGASKTLNSRHLTGHAVDLLPLVGGKPTWAWKPIKLLAPHIKAVARQEGVALDWGGDWWRFPDGAHWELSWKSYK